MNNVPGWILDQAVSPQSRLTQGDLIRFENQTDPLRKIGIVITADCDLEKQKHAKQITLIPVVSVDILMENYLLIEDCEKKRTQIEQYAFREFQVNSSQEIETMKAILSQKLDLISSEESPSVIAAKFALDQIDKISISQYKKLMDVVNINLKKSGDLSKQIRSRGDLLILPNAPELKIEGDIAWVRHIWQVPVTSIAIKTSQINLKDGERVARLDSPYRYRLTQLMAQVFSDIGLPDIDDTLENNIDKAYKNA